MVEVLVSVFSAQAPPHFLLALRLFFVRRMSWDLSVLCEDRPEELPGCSWEEFCRVVGIERPDWAQELLRRIAGRY